MEAISLAIDEEVTGSFDIIRILKNVPQNIKIDLIHGYYFNFCFLNFKKVLIKIFQLDYEDPLFVEWSEFICFIEINQLSENYLFSSVDSETTKGIQEIFIHIKTSNQYNFDCCKVLSEYEATKAYKAKFPDHSSISECELIIPMKYLYSVNFDSNNILSLISSKDKFKFVNQILKAQKISCSISFCSELQYLSKCTSLFPQKCWYSIVEYSKPDNWDEFEEYIKSKLKTDCFDDFSNVNLISIYVCYKISTNSYDFIKRLLLLPNVKNYLIYIKLILPKLSQALSILSLLSDWLFIESVELSYCKNDCEEDPVELIKSSKVSLTKKIGVINELKINSIAAKS